MNPLHLTYAVVGALALFIALTSERLRRLPLSEPLLALVTGVILGPAALAVLKAPQESLTTLALEGARILLAISLMGIGLRYPVRRLRGLAGPLAVLILVALPVMAASTAALAWLILGLPLAVAALLGACLSPTDPVLASSVVTGEPAERDLPARTRRLLSWESGSNDGLAYPLVVLALAVVLAKPLSGEIAKVAYAVVVAVLLGAAIGGLAGKVESVAEKRRDVDTGSSLVFTLVLAVATLGAARLLHVDGVLAVFVAGLAYNAAAAREEREREQQLDEAMNRYLVLPFFLLVGLILPWDAWRELGWAGVVFAVAVLLLRRLPVLLLLRRPLRLAWRDAVFLGWFGPIGVSAVFYLAHSASEGAEDPRLWAVGTLVVAVSTVAHGMSSSPGRRLYAHAAESSDGEEQGRQAAASGAHHD